MTKKLLGLVIFSGLALTLSGNPGLAQSKPRARDLGVPFQGTPGPFNAITDVRGVHVGHATLIRGEGALQVGQGPVRTGVTVILPRAENPADPAFAGWFALNGNGEMTGTTWIEESGFLEGPISITNTHSVGTVRDAIIAWQVERGAAFQPWSLPVVAETYDGSLNDINGFHVKAGHVLEAIESASSGPVAEGNVGGGTGMRCLGFKCGVGTSSRVTQAASVYTVGVLVQANFGGGRQLTIAGVPVGREIFGDRRARLTAPPSGSDRGSIIIVVATDAPLLPHQLKRIARRASLGVARTGGTASNGSGDIFVAFSTANTGAASAQPTANITLLSNSQISTLFEATVEATEEAIINALVAAETMVGRDGNRSEALSHDQLQEILQRYNRLENG
ncbi:MAG: P1 family peptidase [Vicinamibacterales bacterium]|jgi:L-aminopeptidase/D-esterase-like protein|nr:aminopeptidase [Acidobacteriota bacterium]MDP7211195.1 P1 family peptidase [Vicinamibacterales bacterium]HJO16892.1 P1 family peptidase [Vicinamibacterales bacterium]|tara:strand:- start:3587 stop:4762 length:1176 start_codon:yes stop_codon:yes gene_type:complete